MKIKKGDPYIHWSPGFRGRKRVRCDERACYPRASERTANDKLARCYAAQENVEDAMSAWVEEDIEDLTGALESAATDIREVAEEYQESASTINETAEGSPIAEECQEKAESLEEWASEIENLDSELEAYSSEYEGTQKEWADEQMDKIESVMGQCPL